MTALKRGMIFAVLFAALGAVAAGSSARAQNQSEGESAATSNAPREINITEDSAPGWLPSLALEQQALQGVDTYFAALDREQYQQAYAMLAEINRNAQPLAQFIQQNRDFHQQSGPAAERRILKITWTKDSPSAPVPGIYAAVDIVARFANIDRYCGFVILYQRPSAGDFEIMREERNYIDNPTAASIEQQQSRAALDRQWAAMAAYCPNYKPLSSP